MAETTLSSVRGRLRTQLFFILLLSATASGALVGFVGGVALAPLRVDSTNVIVALLLIALVGDLSNQYTGRPRPVTLGTQVPREWRELLDPKVVAGLYGLRLGIGPATILSTWMWWAGALAAGLAGVWMSVMFGALFGATRIVSTAVATRRAEVVGHSTWFGRLRTWQRPGWSALNMLAALVCVAAITSGCSNQVEVENASVPSSGQPTNTTIEVDAAVASGPETDPDALADEETPSVTASPAPNAQSSAIDAIGAADPGAPSLPPLSADELSRLLVSEVRQFGTVPEAKANRFLDLDAATALQPDPTEEGPLLETRGFRGGWTRVFRNDTQDVLVTAVYDFENQTEAAFYREDGLITLGGYGAEFFDIPELPESRGFRTESRDEIGPIVTWGLTFTTGNQWYLLYLVGDPQTATVDVLVSGAIQQYQHLGLVIDDRTGPTEG